MSEDRNRGSKLHMQQFIQLPDLEGRMAALARCTGLTVSGVDNCHPNAANGSEMGLRHFCEMYLPYLYERGDPFFKWWTPHRGKPPTYDLLCTFGSGGSEGIICLEAKARNKELQEPRPKLSSSDSQRREANSRCIRCRIEDAMAAIWDEHHPTPDWEGSRYQLYNRLAWAHRLARLGVDVIVLYVGFTEDPCWPRDKIKAGEWRKTVLDYAEGVLPPDFDDSHHRYGKGTLWFRAEETPVPSTSSCSHKKGR